MKLNEVDRISESLIDYLNKVFPDPSICSHRISIDEEIDNIETYGFEDKEQEDDSWLAWSGLTDDEIADMAIAIAKALEEKRK